MKVTGIAKAAAIVGALAFVASAAPAMAQTKEEAKCRSTIAKNLGKYVATAGKAIVACHKDTNSGKRTDGDDCNNPLDADTTGKVAPTGDTMLAGILKACTGQAGVLAEFSACPSPNQAADGGDGFDDFTEVSDCLEATANTWLEKMYDEVLGAPGSLPLGKDQQKCHGTIAKSVAKVIATIAKDRAKCQSTTDKAAPGITNHVTCSESDSGKIAGARQKLLDGIAKSCGTLTDADWDNFNVCAENEAAWETCALDRAMDSIGGGLSSMAFELPAGCPIGGVRVFINPAIGADRLTNTDLSTGWTGAAFGADVIDGFEGAVSVDCSGSDDCSACTVTLDPVKDQPNSYCRCDDDVTVSCDTIDGADADDCGGGECSCFFGPPLPLAAAGVSTCVVNEIVAELDGLADIGSGDSTTVVSNAAKVHTGGDGTLQRPCPVCVGDTTPNDGNRNGTCDGGDRDGQPCDENGRSESFGGGLSYDCQPDPLTNATGTGLQLALELTSGTTELEQNITCGGALGAFDCWCRTCVNDTTIGCNSAQDCVDAGVGGTCGDAGEPQTAPNACNDATCTASGSEGFGLCLANAGDRFCEAVLQTNGKGIIPCSNNGDCDAVDASCPGGDCGDCGDPNPTQCFTGTISATGTPGSLGAELVSTFCTAHTGNSGVNSAGGLPGPGRLKLDFDFEARCADGDLAQAPGFVNCQ